MVDVVHFRSGDLVVLEAVPVLQVSCLIVLLCCKY